MYSGGFSGRMWYYMALCVDSDVQANVVQGFLPEAVDAFAEAYLYKSFSPLVLGFLLCSSIYGLWKVSMHGAMQCMTSLTGNQT